MKTTISLSGDREELLAIFKGCGFANATGVTGGIEYVFNLPKDLTTKSATDALISRLYEKFGERRIVAHYMTKHDGKLVFVVILGTNLTVVR